MDCTTTRPLLTDLLLEELEGAPKDAVLLHLESCAPCRAEADRLRAFLKNVDAVSAWKEVEPSADFARGLRAARKPASRRRLVLPSRRSYLVPILAAAGLFIAFVSLLLVSSSGPAPVSAPTAAADPRRPDPVPPPAPPKPAPAPAERNPAPPRTPDPAPAPLTLPKTPDPVVPKTPDPAPPVPPVPPKPETPVVPPPTKVERILASFKEASGTFALDGRRLTGKHKDLSIPAGGRIRSETVTRLALADDRFILLAPRTTVEVLPDKELLVLKLETGELLAELVGPGTPVRVTAKACEVDHVGTVFSVALKGEQATVSVEEGRVECRGARGKAVLRAGQQVVAVPDRDLSPVTDSDLRSLAWARTHRAAERPLFQDGFAAKGSWEGEVSDGAARPVQDPAPRSSYLRLFTPGKPVFAVPVSGRLSLTYRAAQPGAVTVQLHALDPLQNFKSAVMLPATNAWRTVVVDFKGFVPADPNDRASRLVPGRGIDAIHLMFDAPNPKGGFWVDSVAAIEARP